ncbi:glycosyltransferase [Clostridium sp. YIM B02515]|uniref:Glycosyltransferase n=1 Tax=Clostridium rhizosphaerae TaxID=2803861 RepID=A0ABS1TGB7_9CLOT|nr:glycosyltransferase [Clostridium rhizosphaerae]MBL4938127.1 glycosyltransferase [Clostridium rhizosphaerae]
MKKLCLLANANSIHTQKWVEYFSDLQYSIEIITLTDTKYEYKPNVKVHYISPSSTNKLSYFLLINKVRKLVYNIKPDILHSHYASSYGMLGRMCNYHPFLVSVWGSDIYQFPEQNILNKILLKYILNGAEAVCSTSEDMKNVTQRYYNGDIFITPFGVDINIFQKQNPIFSKQNITIGVTKSLEAVYGINFLIEGFSKILKRFPHRDLKLLIVGDGSEKEELTKFCEYLGIMDKVFFAGVVANEDIVEHINQMDIVCIPSLSESFGVSAVEASACERPVVASNVGGLKEVVIDNKTGFLIEAKSSEEIANKIEIFIKDMDLARQFGKNGREFVQKKFSWDKNVKIMEGIYDMLIDKFSY